MFQTKIKLSAVLLALAGLLAAPFWYAHTSGAARKPRTDFSSLDRPAKSNDTRKTSPKTTIEKPAKKGKIYAYLFAGAASGLATMEPDGSKVKHFPKPEREEELFGYQPRSARLAPNKRDLAFGVAVRKGNGIYPPEKIYLRDVTKAKGYELLVDMTGGSLANWFWSPDGKKLAFTAWEGKGTWRSLMVDVKTKKVKPIQLPAFKSKTGRSYPMSLQGWSPDGRWFLTYANGFLLLVKTDGSVTRQLTKKKRPILGASCRFSPDGRKLLFVTVHKNKSSSLWVIDIAGGKSTEVVQGNNFAGICARWSPDSRRIAYSVMFINDKGKSTGESNLNVIDADGGNSVTIHRARHDPGTITIHLTDWR